jgi:hypothetical protein
MNRFCLTGKKIVAALSMVSLILLPACVNAASFSDGRKTIIRYSGEIVDQIGDFRPAQGYVYLILSLGIENHGYSEFSTNPGRFYVMVNRISYDIALVSFPEQMKTFGLSDGQRTKGKFAFEVPATVSNSSYEPGYAAFPERFNIEWIKG